MKQFAFPLSIKCASVEERDECIKLLESIGYKTEDVDDLLRVTNVYGKIGICSTIANSAIYLDDSHYIDHFNPALIRDIASVCTNDTWQDGEAALVFDASDNTYYYDIVDGLIYEKICETKSKRPTIAEICEHHGYEIKGRDIVKKRFATGGVVISNCHKSYCETTQRLDEATAEINRLKAENSELKEKLEAVADVDNQELERIRREISELKVKCMTFQDAYNTVRNREIKLKDLLIDIASEMD